MWNHSRWGTRVASACLSVALLAPQLPAQEELVKPQKLSINTWVREDLFAGWMARDQEAFDRGVRKLERYLQDNPNDPTALAWAHFVETYRIRAAFEKGDWAEYDSHMAKAKSLAEKALSSKGNLEGAYIIIGSDLVFNARVARPSDRESMYREGRAYLVKVTELQKAYFDKLPPHMRGELWSLMAVASDRLGETAERDRVLNLMLTNLAGSPYENRAKRWQKQAALAGETDHMCISCHEPGRLKPALAKLQAAPAQ